MSPKESREAPARRKSSRQIERHKPEAKKRDKQSLMIIGAIALMALLSAVVIFWPPDLGPATVVKVETDKGAFTVNLFAKVMPTTVENFVKLVEQGFYDGLKFHRVEDWVVQTGDPTGDGNGGPGWTIPFEKARGLRHDVGAVGMARGTELDSAGSQWYVVKQAAHSIDGRYAVFGKVVEGMDVVGKLVKDDKVTSVTIVSKPE